MKTVITKLLVQIGMAMLPFIALTQPSANGHAKITGTVVDSGSGAPVEFAAVALIDSKSRKTVNGNVADAKGDFVIDQVYTGEYEIAISFIGYDALTIDSIVVHDKKTEINVGTVKLMSASRQLAEVVVQGQRDLIEEKVDRTIYNAENDKTARGGDATDVLKRVPMLSVDMDGNVSLRGNQNIRVLINNKPSTIAAASIPEALKQIPADQIKSVEVITSPSAKYDAEGSAGIINIITKKTTMQGATLSINSALGLRGSNLGLNGSLRQGKMGFSLGGFGRSEYNVHGSFLNRQTTLANGSERLTTQEANTRRNALNGRYTLGWDYDINKNNFLTTSLQYGLRNGKNYQDNLLTQTFQDNNINSNTRNVAVLDNSGTVDLNVDYVHMFQKPQQEFSISGLYSRNNRNYDFSNAFYGNDAVLDSMLLNKNKSYNEEMTLQMDYQSPISKNELIEFGAKNITRNVTSNYKYFHATGSGEMQTIGNAASSNVFNYNQNVSAGYLSYTVAFAKDISLKTGARYEYTTIGANFELPTEIKTTIPSYGVLVPSFNLSKKLKNGNLLKLAFNRRIQRPSIQFLNPNIQASNPLFVTIGNPLLKPEYTNNYELAYSTYIKNSSINIAAFMRNTTGSIQSIRSLLGENVIQTTYANIGEENAYGLNFNGTVAVGNRFSMNGGTDVYYAMLNNNVADPLYHASNSGWVAQARFRMSYKLNKGWELESFSMIRGRQVQLQGTQGAMKIYNLGLMKELPNKKGNIGLNVENFLASGLKIKNYTDTPLIAQQSTNLMRNFSVKIDFDYRIGKMSFDKPKKKKRSVKNDDMKDGGSDN
jgi:outer membrane receptor protein involved in Fe transport